MREALRSPDTEKGWGKGLRLIELGGCGAWFRRDLWDLGLAFRVSGVEGSKGFGRKLLQSSRFWLGGLCRAWVKIAGVATKGPSE